MATELTRFRHDCGMSDHALMLSLSVLCCILAAASLLQLSFSDGHLLVGQEAKTLAFVCVAVIAAQQSLSPSRGIKLCYMQKFPMGNRSKFVCLSLLLMQH